MASTPNKKSAVAIKAGMWYTAANFFDKGLIFLTTPIFTRVLSKTVIGEFSNYTVWMTIITYIATMNMEVTVSRARFDYKDNLNEYISSISLLSLIITVCVSTVLLVFHKPVSQFIGIEPFRMMIMMGTIAFSGSYQMFQIEHRVHYKYKSFVFLTVLLNISTIALSLLFIYIFPDKLLGRTLGYSIPRWIIYFSIFLLLQYKGKCFKWEYCQYCLKICIPYIPHLLSLYILSASDRAMIRMFRGPEEVALYAIGYNCALIVTILATSLNLAWSPWLTEKLHQKNYRSIRKWSTRYIGLFMLLVTAVGLITPEILYFMGGKAYADAIFVLPPVMAGCVFQFCYTMYVNIETYEKKTGKMALATMTGAVVNIVLNYIFIPRYGYVAAAFTTLVGYSVLFVVHFMVVKYLGMSHVYNTGFICSVLAFCCAMVFVYYYLYAHTVVRVIAICLSGTAIMTVFIRHRNEIISFIK